MPSAELLGRLLAAVPPDEARARADEILSRAEYQPPEPTIVDKVWAWIGERVADLFEAVATGGSNTFVAVLLVAGLLGLVGFLVYRLLRGTGRLGRLEVDDAVTVVIEERRAREEWLALAERHESAGEWHDALRCRYRALVAGLIDRGLLRDLPGRTAGEYRRELAGTAPAISTSFTDASDLFERAWYGNLPTGPEESSRFQADAGRVEAG